ncbi:hypothetical protein [Brevibacillus brevis]|nr:hypothetical protein [Brevibacillus brevis]
MISKEQIKQWIKEKNIKSVDDVLRIAVMDTVKKRPLRVGRGGY